jgi:hypothetical protein
MKSALQQVSEQFETAKREYYAMDPIKTANEALLIALTKVKVWGHALQILQDQRGNFVG